MSVRKKIEHTFDLLSLLCATYAIFQYAPIVKQAQQNNPEAFRGFQPRAQISAIADVAEVDPIHRKAGNGAAKLAVVCAFGAAMASERKKSQNG